MDRVRWMSGIVTIAVAVCSLSPLHAQTPPAATVLHVDFERREPVFAPARPSTTSYAPGSVIHVDFERRESVFVVTRPVAGSYASGPIIHVDFERREAVFHPAR